MSGLGKLLVVWATGCLAAAAALMFSLAARAAEPGEAGEPADSALRLAALENGRRALVRVEVTPRWSEDLALEAWGAEAEAANAQWRQHWHSPGADRINRMLDLLARRRRAEMVGVILAPGVIGVCDDGNAVEWKMAGRIDVIDAGGRRHEARLDGYGLRTPVTLLRVDGPEAPPAPAYVPDFTPSLTEPVGGVVLESDPEHDDRYRVVFGATTADFGAEPVAAARLGYTPGPRRVQPGFTPGAMLLVDRNGRAVGARFGGADVSADNRFSWDAAAMLAEAVTDRQVAAARIALQQETLRLLRLVRFEFRPPDPDEEPAFPVADEDGYGPPEDTETYAIVMGGSRLLVPRALHPHLLRQVERITVEVGGDWKPARFVTSWRSHEAMLIEVPGANFGRLEGTAAGKVLEGAGPLLYGHGNNAGGKALVRAGLFRVNGWRRGYNDRLWPEAPGVPVGSLLFDLAGKPAGVCLLERRERRLADIADGSWEYPDRSMLSLTSFAALAKLAEDPAARGEPGWRPMSREEAGRLVWLGVEFDPVTPALARQMNAELHTRSGSLGLLVTAVYPGSPAAKLGLAPDDILLRIEVKGLGEPLPLMTAYLTEAGDYGEGLPEEGDEAPEGTEEVPRTWRPRFNFLTELLTEAGVGRQATVTYFTPKERGAKSAVFELAWAPPDYDGAVGQKDAKLGITIKPLTYEVRHALGLAADAPGVVVSHVEQGSPAQLARLTRHMIVTQVQGAAVKSPAEFAAAVTRARAARLDKIKLQVSALGKSRFADLGLGE